MLHQLRTIGAGVAVLALCFMLASLSWQFLLLGFATASIFWAFWSWSAQLRPEKPNQAAAPLPFEPRQQRRARRTRSEDEAPANIYSFPGQEWDATSTSY